MARTTASLCRSLLRLAICDATCRRLRLHVPLAYSGGARRSARLYGCLASITRQGSSSRSLTIGCVHSRTTSMSWTRIDTFLLPPPWLYENFYSGCYAPVSLLWFNFSYIPPWQCWDWQQQVASKRGKLLLTKWCSLEVNQTETAPCSCAFLLQSSLRLTVCVQIQIFFLDAYDSPRSRKCTCQQCTVVVSYHMRIV